MGERLASMQRGTIAAANGGDTEKQDESMSQRECGGKLVSLVRNKTIRPRNRSQERAAASSGGTRPRRETARNNRDSRRGAGRFRVDILFATAGDTCNAHYTSGTSCSTNLPVAFPSCRVLFAFHEDRLGSGLGVSPLVLYGGVNWSQRFLKGLAASTYKLASLLVHLAINHEASLPRCCG